jgi:hypothetical protein
MYRLKEGDSTNKSILSKMYWSEGGSETALTERIGKIIREEYPDAFFRGPHFRL